MPRLAKHEPYREDALLHLYRNHIDDILMLLLDIADKVTAQQLPADQRLRKLGQHMRQWKPKLMQLEPRPTE